MYALALEWGNEFLFQSSFAQIVSDKMLFNYRFQIYHDKGYLDTCIFKSEWVYGCSDYDQQEPLLYCLRVYLDTVYPEPAPERLDPSLSPQTDLYDEECTIL